MRRPLRHWIVAIAGLLLPAATASAQDDVRDIRPAVTLLLDTSGSMERLPDDCICATDACEECLPNCAAGERSKWNMVLEALTGSWGDAFACTLEERPADTYDSGYAMPHTNHPGPEVDQAAGLIDAFGSRVLFGLMTFDSQPTWNGQPELVFASAWNETLSDTEPGHHSYGDPRDYGFPGCDNTPHRLNLGARGGGFVGPLISTGTGDIAVNDSVQEALLGTGAYHEIRPYGPTPTAALLSDYAYYLENHPDMQEGGDPLHGCRPRYAILLTDGYPNADMRGAPYFCDVASPDNPFGCPYERPEEIISALCDAQNGQCTGEVDGVFVVGFDVAGEEGRARLDDFADLGGTEHAYFASNAIELRERLEEVLALMGLTAPGLGVTSRTPPVLTNGAGGYHAQFNSGYRSTEDGPWEGILERRRYECGTDDLEPEAQPISDVDRFHEVISAQSTRTLHTVLPEEACDVRGYLLGDVPVLAPMGFSDMGDGGGRGGGGRGNGGKNTSCGDSNGNGNNNHDNSAICPAPTADPGNDAFSTTCGSGSGNGNGGGNNNGNGNGNGGGSGNGGGNADTGTTPAEEDLSFVPFTADNDDLTTGHLFLTGAGADDERETIIDWVRGVTRENDLAAIQHSTPVLVGRPEEIADESHHHFRLRDEVLGRPQVLYFGTSDGILHCVSAKAQEGTIAGEDYDYLAGEELWGFVPPALLPNLQSARLGHQPMMDGTPVVRDVFEMRTPGQDPASVVWRTILIVGFRAGGAGYFALDVTDPREPKFLWQFSHPDMGYSYGQPSIAQVLVEVNQGGTRTLQERAIALLPGGGGDEVSGELGCGKCYVCDGVGQLEPPTLEQIASGSCVHNEPLGCSTNGRGTPPANQGTINAREHKKCWDTRGRQLFFVDPITGELVGQLDDSVFGAPLVGGIAAFPGEAGTVSTAAYTTDADGVIWRIDISSPDMSEWSAAPLFDMYWGAGAADGQPAFEAPVVTTDELGNVVVIQATGNVDVFDAFTMNKVVSITESFSVSSTVTQDSSGIGSVDVSFATENGEAQIGANLNWQVTLRPSEQVTGPLALFDGQVFFATFAGMPDAANACAQGESRIWGLHYTRGFELGSDPAPPADQLDPGSECISVEEVKTTGTARRSPNLMDDVRWPYGVFDEALGNASTGAAGRCIGPYENLIVLGTQIAQRPTCFAIETEDDFHDPYIGGVGRDRTNETGGGRFELVAVTGGGTPVPGASLSEVTQQIAVPIQYTRASGAYAGHAE